jgi:hypothetical protein
MKGKKIGFRCQVSGVSKKIINCRGQKAGKRRQIIKFQLSAQLFNRLKHNKFQLFAVIVSIFSIRLTRLQADT